MTRLPPLNDYERSVADNVKNCGWHCTFVSPTSTSTSPLPFAYTVGLFHSYGQPEFIVIGLDMKGSRAVLEDLAAAAAGNRMYPLDRPIDEQIGGLSCAFVPVPKPRYNDYVYSALWFYAERDFPLIQVVWPDRDGFYPWNRGAPSALLLSQPILALPQ